VESANTIVREVGKKAAKAEPELNLLSRTGEARKGNLDEKPYLEKGDHSPKKQLMAIRKWR